MSAPRLTVAEALVLAGHTKAMASAMLSLGDELGPNDPRLLAVSEAFAVATAMLAKATGSRGLPS
jgi:hypothetical protein